MRFWTIDEARGYLPRVRELMETVQAAMAELEDNGVQVRRLGEDGLVDFPAVGDDGDVYYLCWMADEDDIDWWHAPDAGFAGRRRLPR
jgi:hypothetical protein